MIFFLNGCCGCRCLNFFKMKINDLVMNWGANIWPSLLDFCDLGKVPFAETSHIYTVSNGTYPLMKFQKKLCYDPPYVDRYTYFSSSNFLKSNLLISPPRAAQNNPKMINPHHINSQVVWYFLGIKKNPEWPKWKTTKLEDDQIGKTTKLEDDQTGRQPKVKTTYIINYLIRSTQWNI